MGIELREWIPTPLPSQMDGIGPGTEPPRPALRFGLFGRDRTFVSFLPAPSSFETTEEAGIASPERAEATFVLPASDAAGIKVGRVVCAWTEGSCFVRRYLVVGVSHGMGYVPGVERVTLDLVEDILANPHI